MGSSFGREQHETSVPGRRCGGRGASVCLSGEGRCRRHGGQSDVTVSSDGRETSETVQNTGTRAVSRRWLTAGGHWEMDMGRRRGEITKLEVSLV